MRWFIRLVATTIIAVSTGIVALDSSSLASLEWWRPPSGLVVAAIIGVSFGVIWGYIDSEIERRRVRRRNSITSEVHRLSVPVWRKIQAALPDRKTADRVGVHVWIVPTWHWNVLSDRLRRLIPESTRAKLKTPRLWRAMLIRMKDGHESTQIAWRRDVGAIGLAWRKRHHLYVDLIKHWGPAEVPQAVWDTMSHEDRLGLTHAQYVSVREKYASVFVVPIYEHPDEAGSRFIGCVVIDSLIDFPGDLNIRTIRNNVFRLARDISTALNAVI